jgi:tripartite ATP-independent transporter DctM subunit
MTDIGVGLFGIALLLLLMLARVPVAFALLLSASTGTFLLYDGQAVIGLFAAVPYEFTTHWTLTSIPMFLFMGFICFHAQLTQGIFNAASRWLNAPPGDLAHATIGATTVFSALSGSSVACAAAMSKIAVPEMARRGYDPGLSAGVVAAAGTVGSMIPPSILLLVYAVYAEVPVGQLFLAGVLPGLLTVAAFSLVVAVRVRRNPELAPVAEGGASWAERWASLHQTWPLLGIIVVVLGGLFSGVFTPTESGAVGALFCLLYGVIARRLDWSAFTEAVEETLISTASLFVIAIGAAVFTVFLALTGLPDALTNAVLEWAASPVMVLFCIALVFLLLGMFLDPIGIMLITLPILLPVVEASDIHLIWFGILMVKLLEIALVTPPVGLNVFVVKSTLGESVKLGVVFKGVLWFLAADLLVLATLVLFPQLTLWVL